MKALILASAILLTSCADTSRYTVAEQCVHTAGCVSTFNTTTGPSQALAIAPANAGQWEPIVKERKRPKKR